MNKPEHREKPRSTKKAKRFEAIRVKMLLSLLVSLGIRPLISRKDIMIVTNGLAKSSHILGSLENCLNLLTNMAPTCLKKDG